MTTTYVSRAPPGARYSAVMNAIALEDVLTNLTIRELLDAQNEQKRRRNIRIMGRFQRDQDADALLAAIETDPTFTSKLTEQTRKSLEQYAGERTDAEKAGEQ